MRHHTKLRTVFAILGLFFLVAACGEAADPGEDDAADTTAADAGGEEAPDTTAGDSDAGGGDFDPATYFESQPMRFITSSGPGGGTDAKVRTLASQLPRFMEANPATQVSNVEPHVAGMNFLWNADPDGYTVGLTAAPTLEFEFFEEAEWNSDEWVHIGAMDAACDNMLLVKGDLGYESIEDMSGSDGPTLVTMTAAPTPADIEPVALSTMLVADYLDLPLEVKRVAESGQAALNLAMERDEINFARYGASWCILPDSNPGWLEDGFLVPILDVATRNTEAQMAAGVEERGERPPHVSDVLTEEQYAEFRGLVAASREGGNPVFLPPGTPEDVSGYLRSTWEDAIADEDFVESMMSAFGGSELSFLTGEEMDALVAENLEVMTQYSDQFESITEELYAKYVE